MSSISQNNTTSKVCSLCGSGLYDTEYEFKLEQNTLGLSDDEQFDPELIQSLLGEAAARRLGFYHIPADLLLSVVMPVYNEAATIEEAIRRVREVGISKEILIIDDDDFL